MSDHPILKKLKIKDSSPALILNAPEEYNHVIEAIPGDVHLEPQEKYKFVHIFVKKAVEVLQYAPTAVECLDGDGFLWVSYPKKSSKNYKSELSRDHGWEPFGESGFEPVTQVSIDDDWSALRFRHVDNIKSLTRKSALSQKGKERLSGK